ncbi:hypothetical protein QVD17_14818 [Tagetes erecta]|uniref:SHSP domain-containing protein n=1 Tax=Tagetes erecta TaxID=13708 RepID=A0AAD8KN52_TARER|nr:hypothetical protein QVD17_14818 [Tagetes erecta]
MDSKVGGSQSQTSLSFDEFEPLCTWQREDSQDILVIHVPEFKKEQLRIQISNSGILKITGENVIEGKKRRRFVKEVTVTNDYDSSNIHAKFSQGRLRVTLPKKVVKPSLSVPSVVTSPTPQDDRNENNNTNEKLVVPGIKSRVGEVLRSKMLTQVMVNVGFVVCVAFSVYTAYKYWTLYVQEKLFVIIEYLQTIRVIKFFFLFPPSQNHSVSRQRLRKSTRHITIATASPPYNNHSTPQSNQYSNLNTHSSAITSYTNNHNRKSVIEQFVIRTSSPKISGDRRFYSVNFNPTIHLLIPAIRRCTAIEIEARGTNCLQKGETLGY